jgi:uncharacterized protein
MKVSKYNFLIYNSKYKNYFLYNSLKNSLLEIEEPYIINLIKDEDNIDNYIKELTEKEYKELIDNGILCESHNEQFNIALSADRKIENIDKFSKALSITILPTSNCNFRCEYCFEPDELRTKPMAKEVQDDIVKFVERDIKEYGVKYVKIDWYGGEPLLCKNTVINLQERLNKVCKENGAEMKRCEMISNGILLDKNTSDELVRVGIKSIQITIDGMEETHNRRRFCPANPNNNFNRIIDNIKNVNKELKIGIRINSDNSNRQEAYDLVKYLNRIGVWPHRFHHIYVADTTKSLCREHNTDSLFNRKEYIRFNLDFKFWLVKFYNEVTNSKKAQYKFEYPTKFQSGCGYTAQNNSWVISPEGGVYRCWEAIGYRKEIETLSNILEKNIDIRPLAEQDHIKEIEKIEWGCHSCKLFPVCNLLCPYAPDAVSLKRICPDWKFDLEQIFVKQYNFFKENPELVFGFSENTSLNLP